MAKKDQDKKGNEIFEDPNAILNKLKDSEEFFVKNSKIFTYILGAIALVTAAFIFYKYQTSQDNENAQASMYNAVFSWEKDSLKNALNGAKDDPEGSGLVDIIEEYPNTDAGNLAKYYAGVAYLKEGNFEEAINSLKDFNSNDLLLQGWVYSLIGDAYMEQKDIDGAIEYYRKAAAYKSNGTFTPKYLMKAALAYELNKDYESAVESYGKIINDYPAAPQINDAKKYKARAEGLSAEK